MENKKVTNFPEEEFQRMKNISVENIKIDLNVDSSIIEGKDEKEQEEEEDEDKSGEESNVPKDCKPGMEWIYNLTQEGR